MKKRLAGKSLYKKPVPIQCKPANNKKTK